MGYSLFAFLTPQATITAEELLPKIRDIYEADPGATVTEVEKPDEVDEQSDVVSGLVEFRSIHICFESGPQVKRESEEIAHV
jgi:hypothetical protein